MNKATDGSAGLCAVARLGRDPQRFRTIRGPCEGVTQKCRFPDTRRPRNADNRRLSAALRFIDVGAHHTQIAVAVEYFAGIALEG
ncbi:MAG TPA: hypothetical protein VGT79_05945, partial [Xanthomonadaceae bacterium]|nr:hypothetical protein [Xanthomonadaceae bacterium]